MKKVILSIGLGLVLNYASAQVVNSTKFFVGEGAVVSFGTDVTNNGEITNNGKIHLKSDLKNNSKFASKGDVIINGNNVQNISGSQPVELARVAVENDVNLQSPVKVSEEVSFRKGIVATTDASTLDLGENAKYSGASDMSHVAGPMKKTGSSNFQFPVGDGSSLRSFEVKNMTGNTLEAKYVARNPMDVSADLDYAVESINQTEYWTLKSNDGKDVNVKLGDNSDVAYLKNGVWVKENNRFSTSTKDAVMFTSGNGKNIVKEIGVWPNPTQGEFNLKLTGMRDTDKITVDITNQDGRAVMRMNGTVQELRKAYTLPSGMITTNLTVRVINGTEAMTQSLILHR